MEGDAGELQLINFVVTANVTNALLRNVQFELVMTYQTTASMEDYRLELDSPLITIPAGFTGIFTTYINITILGDNIIEDNETVAYCLRPRTLGDLVRDNDRGIVSDSVTLTINIIDNDGKNSN